QRAYVGLASGRLAEGDEAASTGGSESRPVALAPHREVDDAASLRTIDRDEAVEVLVIAEQRFHPAQIAQPLFTDGADEVNVANGLDSSCIECTDHREQFDQSPCIVTDPGRVELAVFFLDLEIAA